MQVLAWIIVFIGLWLSTSYAESYQQIMAIQHAQLYGDKIALPDTSRQQVVSQGQEYIRNMLREQMLKSVPRAWLNGSWLLSNEDQAHAGVETNLTRKLWGNDWPMDMVVRVYADEDINHYLTCGWCLPVEMEMETSYQMTKQVRLNAKVDAPLNSLLRLQVGSEMTWSDLISSHFTYSVSNGSESYDGVSLAIGVNLSSWKLKFNYDMDAHFTQLHYLSLARKF